MERQMKLGFRKSASILWRLFAYMGVKRKQYVLGWLLGLSELATAYITPYIYRILSDIISSHKAVGGSLQSVVMLFSLLLLLTPLVVIGTYLKRSSTAYGSGEMRKAAFAHMQRLSLEESKKLTQGNLITQLTSDITAAANTFNTYAITGAFKFVVYVVISLGILLMNDWRFALTGLVLCIVSVISSILLNPKIRYLNLEAKETVARSTSFLMEALRGAPVIRVFLLAKKLTKKYAGIVEKVAQRRFHALVLGGISESLVYSIIGAFAQPIGFILGIALVVRGQMSIGQAIFLASVLSILTEGLKGFSAFSLYIQSGLVSAQRVFDTLDRPIEVVDGMKKDITNDIAVALEEISFSYDERSFIVSKLSMRIKIGECVALVGRSGSGKTTALKLISQLYEPAGGCIKLFGEDVLSLGKHNARQLISYVPQDGMTYDGSIADNIRFGKLTASMEEIISAAKKADIHDFILSLPEGYSTNIGERGSQISGGQRQRIAIARAIIKDAPILLLDEATSSLDTDTEQRVQSELFEIFRGKTIIIVAHRLSTIQKANRIFFMHDGAITEEGCHDELLSRGGGYESLYLSGIH